MPLLTDIQIKQATKDDLLALLRSIHDHLDADDEVAALVVARSILARHGKTEPLRITFGVDEWDDGYFYSGIQRIEDATGNEVTLPETLVDALEAAMEEPLTGVSYNSRPGRFSKLTVDLVCHTISR